MQKPHPLYSLLDQEARACPSLLRRHSSAYYTIIHSTQCCKFMFINKGMSNNSTQPTTEGILLKFVSHKQSYNLQTSQMCHKKLFYMHIFIHSFCISFHYEYSFLFSFVWQKNSLSCTYCFHIHSCKETTFHQLYSFTK